MTASFALSWAIFCPSGVFAQFSRTECPLAKLPFPRLGPAIYDAQPLLSAGLPPVSLLPGTDAAMWFDLVIFGLLLFCTVRGAAKGFVWQLAAIGALVICFFFAQTASTVIAPHINVKPPLNRWISMFVLYLGASFVSFALARSVRRSLESMQFVEYDKHLGAIFGLLKGVGFALVITFFAVTLSASMRDDILASYSGQAAARVLAQLHPVLPDELHPVIDPYLEHFGTPLVHDGDQTYDGYGDVPGGEFGPLPSRPGQGPSSPLDPGPPGYSHDYRPPSRVPDDFGPAPDGYGPAPGGTYFQRATPARNTSSQQTPIGSGDSLTAIVQSLPGVNPDVKQLALTALKNTKPEDRDELVSQFQTAIPGLIHAAAVEWQNGKPATPAANTRQAETLREIAAIYTDKLDGQRTITREAEQRLRGLPDEVALTVIQDWYADLLELTPDPDPATSLETLLDQRIVRQLRSFRIAPETLNADLRNRLSKSVPR